MSDIKDILKDAGFKFDKRLGQNFITDANLLRAIVADSGLERGAVAVEIGAGAGTLTRELAKVAGRVISYEVDESLKPVLSATLAGLENVELRFYDILKRNLEEEEKSFGGQYFLIANLPYYITTPLIMAFLEKSKLLKSMTVMVQREVADRLCAKPGGKDYGSLTVAVDFRGGAKVVRHVSRAMFHPMPNVDSAVVRIDIERGKYPVEDEALFIKLCRAAFSMRRKTLLNNLLSSFNISREAAQDAIQKAGFSPDIRGEKLSASDFARLANVLFYTLNKNI